MFSIKETITLIEKTILVRRLKKTNPSKAIVIKQTRSACIEDLEDTYPGISRDEVEKGKDEIKRLVRKKEYRPNRRG